MSRDSFGFRGTLNTLIRDLVLIGVVLGAGAVALVFGVVYLVLHW